MKQRVNPRGRASRQSLERSLAVLDQHAPNIDHHQGYAFPRTALRHCGTSFRETSFP